MEFENRLADYWHSFWNARFAKVPLTNDDLMRQTANTINKVPLPIERIQQRAGGIAKVLQLRAADELVDFCCGNGLVDFELAPYVNSITGIDFAENLIAAAQPILVDDLGHVATPGVRDAIEDFRRENPSYLLVELFPHQGLLLPLHLW